MRTLRQLFKFMGTACSLGLLLAGLLGGCHQPFVNVNVQVDVDNCQAGRGRSIELPAPGACNQTLLTNNTTDPNLYNNAWNMATNTAMGSDHSKRCNTSTWMCQSAPGSKACPIPPNKLCKTRFTPTSGIYGNCTCGCPP